MCRGQRIMTLHYPVFRFHYIISAFALLLCTSAAAQTSFMIRGAVRSAQDSSSVPGATVVLKTMLYDKTEQSTVTDDDGRYQIQGLQAGAYHLIVMMVGFETDTVDVAITDADVTRLRVFLKVKELKAVQIEEALPRMEIKGDTVQYNANAYKVNPDATAEDLLRKMPGVTTDGSSIKVNGEEIKRVLVDGKPFFNDDPAATLRNLPADMVENMQIFDKQSDEAEFGGFKDGSAVRTLNVRTRGDRKQGKFGKVYTGGGTNDRYNLGFTANSFKKTQRITLLGMANNINQQNFSMQDIMGMMSNSGQGGGQGGGGRGGQGGGGGQNFFNGQQNGITTTKALGLNYNDSWGKKWTVSGNYFFNQSNNDNSSNTIRNFYTADQLRYTQNSIAGTENINHRGFLKLEFAADSNNKFLATTRFTTQNYNSKNVLGALSNLPTFNENTNSTDNTTVAQNQGYTLNSDVQWQHKFKKNRRTLSLNMNTQANERNGDGGYVSTSIFFLENDSTVVLNQSYTNNNKSLTLSPSANYTEPLGKNSILQFTAKPSWSENDAEKITSNVVGSNLILDTSLSNKYRYTYNKQSGGVYYRYATDSVEFSIGSDIEQSHLRSDQTYPQISSTDRTFFNILPNMRFTRRYPSKARFVAQFNSSTQAPSVAQLQNVIDVSNVLFVRSGNIGLKQSRDNTMELRYILRIPQSEKHMMFMLSGTQTLNYVSTDTRVLRSDTVVNGITVPRGAQWIVPLNMNNYFNGRAFAVYGIPLKKVKSTLNLQGGYTITQTPAVINTITNLSLNQAVNGGLSISSNVSEAIDFTLGYNAAYNSVVNNVITSGNTSYYTQNASLRANWIIKKRIVLNSDAAWTNFTGLSQSFKQNYVLWNAYVGYKFGKNNAFELKISCFDILKQNISISRTVNATYVEDVRTQTLTRYGMLTLTYTFKKFEGKGPDMPDEKEMRRMYHGPGMGQPPGTGVPRD